MRAGRIFSASFLAAILVTICIGVIPRASVAKIFDGKRAGFMVGGYGGLAPGAKYAAGTGIDMSYMGIVYGVSAGYGISQRVMIGLDLAVVNGEMENQRKHTFNIGSFDLIAEYCFTDGPKPWFVNGGVGRSVLYLGLADIKNGTQIGTAIRGGAGKFIFRHVWIGGSASHCWGDAVTATSVQVLVGVMGF